MDEILSIIKKFNFWDDRILDLGYARTQYTDKIVDFTGNRLIKVLVGQRRTGKSYLLRQVANHLINNGVSPINTLFINKEFTDFEFLANYKDLGELIRLYKSEMKPVGRVYIFIDEVQNIEGFEPNSILVLDYAGVDNQGYGLIRKKDGSLVQLTDDSFGVKFSQDDLVSGGTTLPKYTASLNNTINYEGFGLSFMFVYQGGFSLLKDSTEKLSSVIPYPIIGKNFRSISFKLIESDADII